MTRARLENTSNTEPTENGVHAHLTIRQVIRSAAFGVVFWLVAALFVRYTSSAKIFGGSVGMLTFALSVPVCWVSVRMITRFASLQKCQILPSVVAATVAATVLDGVAMTWTRSLYSESVSTAQLGAAWILFGVGMILAFAFRESLKAESPTSFF